MQRIGTRNQVGPHLHSLEIASKAAPAEADPATIPYEDRDPAVLPEKSIRKSIFFQVTGAGLILRAVSRRFGSMKFPDPLKPKLQDAAVSLRGTL